MGQCSMRALSSLCGEFRRLPSRKAFLAPFHASPCVAVPPDALFLCLLFSLKASVPRARKTIHVVRRGLTGERGRIICRHLTLLAFPVELKVEKTRGAGGKLAYLKCSEPLVRSASQVAEN